MTSKSANALMGLVVALSTMGPLVPRNTQNVAENTCALGMTRRKGAVMVQIVNPTTQNTVNPLSVSENALTKIVVWFTFAGHNVLNPLTPRTIPKTPILREP